MCPWQARGQSCGLRVEKLAGNAESGSALDLNGCDMGAGQVDKETDNFKMVLERIV